MNTKSVTFAAIILSAFATNLVAMNYGDACRILADEPFMPAAGETPQEYQQRLAKYKTRKNLINDLANARSELATLTVQSRKLEIQIQTGMLIPDKEEGKPTPLTEDQKGSLLKEFLNLQEKIVREASVVRNLAEAVAEDDARIDADRVRQEISDAQFRQTEELRQEIREEHYNGRCR